MTAEGGSTKIFKSPLFPPPTPPPVSSCVLLEADCRLCPGLNAFGIAVLLRFISAPAWSAVVTDDRVDKVELMEDIEDVEMDDAVEETEDVRLRLLSRRLASVSMLGIPFAATTGGTAPGCSGEWGFGNGLPPCGIVEGGGIDTDAAIIGGAKYLVEPPAVRELGNRGLTPGTRSLSFFNESARPKLKDSDLSSFSFAPRPWAPPPAPALCTFLTPLEVGVGCRPAERSLISAFLLRSRKLRRLLSTKGRGDMSSASQTLEKAP